MSVKDVVRAIEARHSFVLTSHARPDGDAIGSQIALGLALESLGKTVKFQLSAVGVNPFGLQIHALTSVKICW